MILTVLFLSALLGRAEIKHEFVCVDNQHNQLVYVDQFTGTSWKIPLPKGSRDLVLLDEKRVIVSHPDGAEIYRLKDGKSIRRFEGFQKVCSVSPAEDGHFLLGSPEGFTVIDSSGKIVRTVLSKAPVDHLRLARMLKNGNIIYCADYDIFEIDTDGEPVWTHKDTGKTYLALKLGKSLLSTRGKEVQLVRVERDGTETIVAGGKENHPNANLAWFSGYAPLPDGNVVVANWRGHGFEGESKHLFEFDAENKIVWSWDNPDVKGVTTVQVIR